MFLRNLHIRQLAAAGALLVLTAPALAVTYSADLTSHQAVPPNPSTATGEATFRPDKADARVRFRVSVKNLYDIMEAHLYMGFPGQPATQDMIVATLYPGPLRPGKTNGTLCTGDIGAEDLVGQLEGHGFDELVRLLEEGRLFVTVITIAFPEGEIRGQVY